MGRTGADDDFVSGMWIKERSHISEAADLTGLACQNRFLGARELYKPSFGVIETVVVLNSKKMIHLSWNAVGDSGVRCCCPLLLTGGIDVCCF